MSEKIKIGVILLGASTYPNSTLFQSFEAFKESYKRIKNYFLEHKDLDILGENILDLFNSKKNQIEIIDNISKFIKAKNEITDLIIYYVGHGGFDVSQGYVLAIDTVEDNNLALTGLLFKNLANTLKNDARNLRNYLILDCCFSGEALPAFQSTNSNLNQLIAKQFIDDFPETGTALFCSTSKELPSIIVEDRNITMFTEGLEKSLIEGSRDLGKYLTFKELRELTFWNIKQLNPKNPVRPEIHTPIQPQGDITELVHLFPNYSLINKVYDINSRAKEIRMQIAQLKFTNASNLMLDFVFDFDIKQIYIDDATLLAMKWNSINEEREIEKMSKEKIAELNFKFCENCLKIITELGHQNV